jgi:hypothetical protein
VIGKDLQSDESAKDSIVLVGGKKRLPPSSKEWNLFLLTAYFTRMP